MKKIVCSAPAKVILSGEHAVVYGKPSLVSAINLRLRFSIWGDIKSTEKKSIVFIADLVKKFLKKENIHFQNKNFSCQIESEIPIGQGLGSSAALSVAATAAFLRFYSGKKYSQETISNLAYQAEKYFHKNPSGVDVAASTFGGLIFFRKEFEFLKNISSLNFKIPEKIEENLYIIDSGKAAESTADMVLAVGKLYNKKPKIINDILSSMEKITKKMTVAIVKEDANFFSKNIADNQTYLERLKVVSKKTKDLLDDLTSFGAGKVTGAGGKKIGSGFILFYSKKGKELNDILAKKNLRFYKFKQDYQGLIYEN